jgi:hypothetical protein
MSTAQIFADVLLAHSEHDFTPISKAARKPTEEMIKQIRFQLKHVHVLGIGDTAEMRTVLIRIAALSFAAVEGIDAKAKP